MKGAIDVHRALLAQDVPHEIVRLPRPVLHADEIPDVLGLPPQRCLVVRVYETEHGLIAALVRAGDLPHPAAMLLAAAARRLSPAPADLVNRMTDYAASLVSPVLLPEEVRLVADAAVGMVDVVYAPTGDSGTALGIAAQDLLRAAGAQIADLCASGPADGSSVDVTTIDLEAAELLGLPSHDWR